jgi:phage terminase large subunit GpA-like protein
LVKGIRVGFTTLISSAIASYIVNDPSPIMVLLPTESDARSYMVSDIEPIFSASPALQDLLEGDDSDSKRNTLLQRGFKGGHFLKILPAMAPHNLRSHNVRILFCDEVDGYEVTSEGSAVKLAIGRTMSYPNRKVILGSTPKDKDTSEIIAAYNESDRRIFEVPCPECGAFHELTWKMIKWPKGEPEKAYYQCPSCEAHIDESFKGQMIEAGEWRATKPEVKNHAGFRLNTLVSPQPNARWGTLAAEWLAAQASPHSLRVFVNQVLAQPWEIQSMVDRDKIASRVQNFDLNNLPWEVIALTAGIDVQDDRLEIVVLGWSKDMQNPVCFVIHHRVIFGHFTDPQTWIELDQFLLSKFRHPSGETIWIDGAIVDASDGDHWATVMDFCNSRFGRRHIWAGKGFWGSTRKHFTISKDEKKRFAMVGTDSIKGEIIDKLQTGQGIRFSSSLSNAFFQQLASEHRVVRLKAGMPVRKFERVSSGARAEALDCLVYAVASKADIWPKILPVLAERIARFRVHDAPIAPLPELADTLAPAQATPKSGSAEWYETQIQQFPELRNDPEVARLLKEIEEADDDEEE